MKPNCDETKELWNHGWGNYDEFWKSYFKKMASDKASAEIDELIKLIKN